MARLGRRGFLVGGAGVATAATFGRWLPLPSAAALDRTLRTVVDPTGTTLAATIVPTGSGPYRLLTEGPGEPHTVRTDLLVPKAGREDRRTPLLAFVHFTDQHLIDAQSPGRVDFIDQADPLFGGAFRPQELLTTQVATSMVERVNQLRSGPVSGRRFDGVVCTGDNIDNQQRNELDWLLAILDGGTVTPDSGNLGTYEGIQDDVAPALLAWHPDAGVVDDYKSRLGYPDVPGLLDRALVPFRSPGLDVPWFSVYGNHDCNIQGNAARSDALDTLFTGDRKITGLAPGTSAFDLILAVMNDSPSILHALDAGDLPFRTVGADEGRRTATIDHWLSAHLASPTGTHGYGAADLAADRLHHEFDLAPGVVGIALDTTNHRGGIDGAGGSIGSGQLAWLEERLAAHHARFLAPDGSVVRGGGDDRVVVVFSHHTSGTMQSNDPDPAHPAERRIQGPELVSVLLRYPNVVAWVNGHTHTNEVAPHRHPQGLASGFWEISTASHVDWPQQARVVELVDNHDGTLSIFGTMIEHAAPAAADRDASDAVGLAGLSRELGVNDASANPSAKAGSPAVRNVELVLAAPFANPAVAPSTTTTASVGEVPGGAVPVPGTPSYTG